MVLDKTLESPLDCKEIQPVHPKGNQSLVFIGRTDAEAETPILWPLDEENPLIGKDPDAGRDWGQEEKGTIEDEMVGWHHRLDGHEFEQAPGDGEGQEAWRAAVHGVTKSWTRLSDWTELNLREAEDIKERWQEYTEQLHKKDLHDPDKHDGVITNLEPDILECEVKWALGSITMNKASECDGIPAKLFQILKDDAVKVLHSICQQI